MHWSDATWHSALAFSAITEHKETLFQVTIEFDIQGPKVTANVIDSDGLVLFHYDKLAAHRYIKPALRAWLKERWLEISQERCFEWFPARAMRFGLDTVLAKYDAQLKRRAKARKCYRGPALAYHEMLSEKFSATAATRDTPPPDELPAKPGPRRIRKSNSTSRQRPPLLGFDGPPQPISLDVPDRVPAGAYDRLMRDRTVRWQVYVHVCEELSAYRERRDEESLDRFLALINSFWELGGVRFEHVPGNPDAVTVDIWPNYDQPKARVTLDLKGII